MPENNFLIEVMRFSAGDKVVYTNRVGDEIKGTICAVHKPIHHLDYALIKFIPKPKRRDRIPYDANVWSDLDSRRFRPVKEGEFEDAKNA